jgi:predicted PurR-regulated permease PerM
MMQTNSGAPWLRHALLIAALALVLVLAFAVLSPFIVALIWAGILSYASWPAYVRVRRWCRNSSMAAALLMTLVMTAAVIAPTGLLVLLVRVELIEVYRDIEPQLNHGLPLPDSLLHVPLLGSWLQELNARVAADPQVLAQWLRTLMSTSAGQVGSVLGTLSKNLGKLLVTVISLYFLYRDGATLTDQMHTVLGRFFGPRARSYLDSVGQTVKAVLVSLVLGALVQGILGGVAYWAVGVKAPLFAAVVTTLAALIPFAVWIVWAAVIAWLVATGHTVGATVLALWCLLVLSWVDNVVRSALISNATHAPFLIVMFGVLGGLLAFGLVGLFIGPVILAVLLAIWRESLTARRGADPAS